MLWVLVQRRDDSVSDRPRGCDTCVPIRVPGTRQPGMLSSAPAHSAQELRARLRGPTAPSCTFPGSGDLLCLPLSSVGGSSCFTI